jgi:hypothetical protein
MAPRPNKNDLKLLACIAEHKVLTVHQLSALSQRSGQVIRRRLRVLESETLVTTKQRGYGRNPGRPEDLIFLTEKGAILLKDKETFPSNYVHTLDNTADPIFIDHELLVNWFNIHLLQIEKVIPTVAVCYAPQVPHSLTRNMSERAFLRERIPKDNTPEEFSQVIPDAVFSITHKDTRKTLLFFLEVDMGTETIASLDRDTRDIRQKIINYQALFSSGSYKRYERIFKSKLNGFRLVLMTNTAARLTALCRLVQEMPPADFIWLTDQQKIFSHGVSGEIWVRGGRNDQPPQSILGPRMARDARVVNHNR